MDQLKEMIGVVDSVVPHDLSQHLSRRGLSAERTLTLSQTVFFSLLGLGGVLFAWFDLLEYVTFLIGLAMGLYILMMGFQLLLSIKSADPQKSLVIFTKEELESLPVGQLPVISVLIPLYREGPEVVGNLIRSIKQQRYPVAKQDIILVLEEDDPTSLAAVQANILPKHVSIVIVPHSNPKTKPKACTYALQFARGTIVGVWDAEDRPEPWQLLKVACSFRKVPMDVVCVQARLEFHNPFTNLLTRFFSAEYTMWFQLGLPGLGAMRLPVPLGGTSNFFRLHDLIELGAWDGWNVTEDAHLGVLIARARKHVLMFDSVTWEEANSAYRNWIRQRSRWIKGKMQTYLVNMRSPIQLYRELGPKGFFAFQLMYGAMPASLLFNPVFWIIFPLDLWRHLPIYEQLFPLPVLYMGTLSLFVGNAAFFVYALAGTMIRGNYRNTPWMFLSPIYWALMSLAAWKGFLQLISKSAHKWEKTVHGLVDEVIHTLPGEEAIAPDYVRSEATE